MSNILLLDLQVELAERAAHVMRRVMKHREKTEALMGSDRGHLETLPHVLKAVLHNEEHPGATPMGRNRHERRALAAAMRKGKRVLARVKKQMVRP